MPVPDNSHRQPISLKLNHLKFYSCFVKGEFTCPECQGLLTIYDTIPVEYQYCSECKQCFQCLDIEDYRKELHVPPDDRIGTTFGGRSKGRAAK